VPSRLSPEVNRRDGRQRAQPRLFRQEALNNVMGRLWSGTAVQAKPIEVMCLEHANQIGA
jgi:hypothetical protein